MFNTKISILIPTYNRVRFLPDAIESALSQTYQDIEILVLDDASPDDTAAVAGRYRGEPRLRYIRHSQNLGITGNWRKGIEAATGDFFCLLHDDDTFEPEFVERLLEPLLQDKNLILSFCDQWVMNADGERNDEESKKASGGFKRDLLPSGSLSDFARSALVNRSLPAGASLYRRSMVSPDFIDEEAKGSIDFWLLYQCIRTGYGAYFVKQRLMNYRVHGGGMSGTMLGYMMAGHLYRNRAVLNDERMKTIHAPIKAMYAFDLTACGIGELTKGNRVEARRFFIEGMRCHPNPRTFLTFCLSCLGGTGTQIAKYLQSR